MGWTSAENDIRENIKKGIKLCTNQIKKEEKTSYKMAGADWWRGDESWSV